MEYLKKIGQFIIDSVKGNGCKSMYCSTQCCLERPTLESAETINSSTIKDDNPVVDNNTTEPLVCILNGKELLERKELLRKEIFSKVKSTEEIDCGYIFSFQYEKTFLLKMTDYIITENACCPFFTFNTMLHSKDDALLKITGPSKQAKEMIKEFLDNSK